MGVDNYIKTEVKKNIRFLKMATVGYVRLNEEFLRSKYSRNNRIIFPSGFQVSNFVQDYENSIEGNGNLESENHSEEISNSDGSSVRVRAKCYNYNMGYCKFRRNCANFHPPQECSQKPCYDNACQKRHRIPCKFFLKKGKCKFGKRCEFLHEGGNSGSRSKRRTRDSSHAGEQRQSNVSNSSSVSSSRPNNVSSSRQSNASSSRPSNVSNSRQKKVFSLRDENIKRKIEEDFKSDLMRMKELEEKLKGDKKLVTEKVDNVANQVKEVGSGINNKLKELSSKVIAVNNSINGLWEDVRKLRKDCEEHDSNQERLHDDILATRRNESLPVQKAEPPSTRFQDSTLVKDFTKKERFEKSEFRTSSPVFTIFDSLHGLNISS